MCGQYRVYLSCISLLLFVFLEQKMAEEVFEVNVYKPPFNPQRPDKNIIGTVRASYVPDGQGGYLTD